MKQRGLLRKQVICAWSQTVYEDYGKINSERSLQAAFWAHLYSQFTDPTRRQIFIEPSIAVDGVTLYPDLIICNSKTVIGVIELKYLPRGAVRYDKDLSTLASLRNSSTKITLQNRRYAGDKPPREEYRFADHVLFAWAGVYSRMKSVNLDLEWLPEVQIEPLSGCFLELHAVTAHDGSPVVKWRPQLPSDVGLVNKATDDQ